ncbi:GMP synthase [Streptomyces sp. NRRL F-6491]|nr:GMP synthase [Streptomyces sp. NRRL F-6491]KOX52302.1 GMP synthase [Streptomyces sp. NRRL F-6492]
MPQLRKRFEDLGSETTVVDVASVPTRLNAKYQAIVLSGTKVRAFDGDYYKTLIDLVMGAKVPVFGICGGMQIIAVANGGELKEGPQRVGGYEVRVDKDEPLFSHVKPTVTVFHRHTLYLQAAPAGFRSIGRSEHAPVEFLRSDDGRVFGAQAHLEFRSDGTDILRGFAETYQ